MSMGNDDITAAMLPERPVGLFYAWWAGDALPDLRRPLELIVEHNPSAAVMRQVVALSDEQIRQRLSEGNQALVARMGGAPAAIGWSSAGRVEIGELGLDFTLPPGHRYLWDFVTLPEWRGRGIYPALLQEFLEERTRTECFWVGHDLENAASARGILRAGFQTVGEVYAVPGVGPVFVAGGMAPERAPGAARLLGIPLLRAGGGGDNGP
jgi:GNAT superfamily N-acetyltransferase